MEGPFVVWATERSGLNNSVITGLMAVRRTNALIEIENYLLSSIAHDSAHIDVHIYRTNRRSKKIHRKHFEEKIH